MDNYSNHEPLLVFSDYAKKRPLFLSLAKWILKGAMWVIFITWVASIFLYPADFVTGFVKKSILATDETLFGVTGSTFLIFSAPILLIAFLGIAYLALFGESDHDHGRKSSIYPRFRLWTFPVIVGGPLGVVSAAEIIGIFVLILYLFWAFSAETLKNTDAVSKLQMPSTEKSIDMLKLTGRSLGSIGLFCLALLFLPISRGSVLLRLIDIPFEHATRYHVWMGHVTMALFTLHGLCYTIVWFLHGRLIDKILSWKNTGIANLPGVIALLAGLLMWITSLPGLRRRNFELFFYTHQLYVVFVVFFALHVGDFIFAIAAGGIFLFMLDRFLRFFQSRKTVNVLSARSFPCGTVELLLSKPANLRYNALSWIFLQVCELSLLQWHPFSVSSSPLDGKHHLAILIKVLGDWTGKLEKQISTNSEEGSESDKLLQSYSGITASVEGPYGHESPYHLTYENLILIAGGIGISPFLAILSDVLHRIKDGKPCLPRNILIIWAVKTSTELPLLHTINTDSICPSSLNLEIQTYVTRESEPSLEEGTPIEPINSVIFPTLKKCGISGLVGTGNIIWSGMYVIASTIGLIVTMALLDIFYVTPHNVTYWWYKGLLFIACMVMSILLFGGIVIGFWHIWERKKSVRESEEIKKNEIIQQNESNTGKKSGQEKFLNTVLYGQRPDFKEIFESMSDKWGHVDIGVILCGPSTLQTSVAKECRTQNLKRRRNQAIFHFNSHSFDL